jgi:hypothetical protein
MRAADSDRERVVDMLKTAFVQGRLTKPEFDARVGQTLLARTFGDLTALTADIPSWPLPRPARKPATTTPSPSASAIIKAVACAMIALIAIAIAGMPGAWTTPAPASMTAQACQIFANWQKPVYRNYAMLSQAVAIARQGTDYPLATDLTALQLAQSRYYYLGDLKQMPGDRQMVAAASQVTAAADQVANDCVAAGD